MYRGDGCDSECQFYTETCIDVYFIFNILLRQSTINGEKVAIACLDNCHVTSGQSVKWLEDN